jgi:hypothetical protein
MMTTGMRSSLPMMGSAPRQLVGHRQDGRLQHVAGRILLAQVALERLEPRHADGDVDQPLAPRPAEGVGDDDAQVVARQGPQPIPQLARGAV